MNIDIREYHDKQASEDKLTCDLLHEIICENLTHAESKVWHAHPVWFLDGNPIVGYSKLKNNIRLMFWSGQSFDEPKLIPTGSFKASEVIYTNKHQINPDEIKRYLKKSIDIQWDYKHIIKNRGLNRLK